MIESPCTYSFLLLELPSSIIIILSHPLLCWFIFSESLSSILLATLYFQRSLINESPCSLFISFSWVAHFNHHHFERCKWCFCLMSFLTCAQAAAVNFLIGWYWFFKGFKRKNYSGTMVLQNKERKSTYKEDKKGKVRRRVLIFRSPIL